MSLPPPPPPVLGVGLPPPPLPNTALPPPSVLLPPPPPPTMALPHPHPHHPPLPMPMMGGGLVPPRGAPPPINIAPPPPRSAPLVVLQPPNVVIMTGVPPFLHHARALRDWIAACGNARSVQLVPAVANTTSASSAMLESSTTSASSTMKKNNIALLTMSHADAALRLVTAFKVFKTAAMNDSENMENENTAERKDDNDSHTHQSLSLFQAHLVPTNPDVPLPPAFLDPNLVQNLADKLRTSYDAWKNGEKQVQLLQKDHSSNPASLEAPPEQSTTTSTSSTGTKSQARNADDDEGDLMDPMQSAQVRQAVQDFRAKIEKLQGSKSNRRKDLVLSKIEQLLPIVRLRLQQEREEQEENRNNMQLQQEKQQEEQLQQQQQLPPPPPPPHLHSGLPPPPLPINNLPVPPSLPPPPSSSSSTDEPPSKRAKVLATTAADDVGGGSMLPASLLRDFVATQIRQFLGEDEPTLLDFIVQTVLSLRLLSSAVANNNLLEEIQQALSNELKEVLDEDAPAFLQALANKVQELLILQEQEQQLQQRQSQS